MLCQCIHMPEQTTYRQKSTSSALILFAALFTLAYLTLKAFHTPSCRPAVPYHALTLPKIAVAAQGTAEEYTNLHAALSFEITYFIYLAYDKPCPSLSADSNDDPHQQHPPISSSYCVYLPNSTWTQGRNRLAYEIQQQESAQGYEFKYWVLMDADIMNTNCIWCPPGANSTVRCCMEAFISLLRQPNIQFATVAPFQDQNSKLRPYKLADAPCVDARFNAFHRAAVPVFLPYWSSFDSRTWWASQQLLWQFSYHCFPSHSHVAVGGWVSDNKGHSPYPRGNLPRPDEIQKVLSAEVPDLVSIMVNAATQTLPDLDQGIGQELPYDASQANGTVTGTWMKHLLFNVCKARLAQRWEILINHAPS